MSHPPEISQRAARQMLAALLFYDAIMRLAWDSPDALPDEYSERVMCWRHVRAAIAAAEGQA